MDEIIPNKYHNSDKHRGIMCIPYVEAWYPKPIQISAIEKCIIVFTNKNPVDFFIVSKQELGYLFGSALEAVIGNIKHYEIIILGGIATTGILIWIVYYYYRSTRYPK